MAKNFSFLWTIFIILQLNGVTFIKAHVGLTFPPARKYDLDFLDNIRSRAPCGMPKGKSRTQLMAGSAVNITWHLAYPHRGGYKLELFDMNEKYLMDLTPKENNEEYVLGDATAQWHSVSFSKDVICKDCTIRLIRTAKEWANSYRFWSCADVDIVAQDEYKRSCSGHGKLDSATGLCSCDKRFWGPDCAYEDECLDDGDCGGTGKGQCVDLGGTALPRKQCFCAPGYHGEKCTMKNKDTLPDSKSLDLSSHKKNILSDRFSLFHKVIPAKQENDKEIEFVLVINGTSYGALGWRSSDTEAVCKQWPFINDIEQRGRRETKPTASAVAEPESEPEAEAEPTKLRSGSHAEPESESEPEKHHDAKAEPEAEAEAEPEKHHDSKAEPEPEPEKHHDAKAEPEAEAEPESHKRNYKSGKPEPESEPESEAKGNARKGLKAEPEPESEPTSEPEPEGSTKPEPESTKNKNKKSSSASAEPEPETPTNEPEPESGKHKGHPEPEPESGKHKGHPEPEPESGKHKGHPEPEPESGKHKGHPEPEPESGKHKGHPEPEPEIGSKPHAEPEAEPESSKKGHANSKPESEPTAINKRKYDTIPKSEPNKHSKPEPESESEPAASSEPEPEAEAEPTTNKHKPTSIPEPEKESEPEAEAESKPNKNNPTKPIAEPEAEAEPESSKSKTKIKSKYPEKSHSEPHAEPESEPESSKKPEKFRNKPASFKKTSNSKLEAEPESESEPKMPQRIFRENESLLRPVRKSEKNRPRIRSKALEQGSGETYTISSKEEEATTLIPETMEMKETKTIRKLKESPYTPKGDFHAMDCTDIILGSARGSYSRIMDYYTRDRSTPRLDSFYGGTNNILSATGWEIDGQTTLIFRRKLLSEDPADHSIKGEMHVIWARGQESGEYVHKPPSGLEKENAAHPEFYAKDEIKYHGHRGQRGVTFINFSD